MKLLGFAVMFAGFMLCCLLDVAFAEIYYWLDQNGVKHFSSDPPADQPYYTLEGKRVDPPEPVRDIPTPQIQEGGTLTGLLKSPETPIGRKLKAIQETALPAALEGNLIAIHICRQTMFGLGETAALDSLPLDSARVQELRIDPKWLEKVVSEAAAGDAFYKTVMGVLYLDGHGFPVSIEKALALWQEAASLGYHDALCKLGNILNQGTIVPADIPRALTYYNQAAQAGSSIAWYNMGAIYYHGKGVPKDQSAAVRYYMKAAEMDNAAAQRDLGHCYLSGTGVDQDRQRAAKWYQAAAQNGDYIAKATLARMGIAASDPEAKTTSDAPADKPHYFYKVEICDDCIKGIYKDIRICDLKTIKEKIGADLSLLQQEDSMGWTPLTLAIAAGCKNTVAYLLDYVDVNQRHRQYDFTPLHLAVFTGQKDIAEQLLSHGADMNAISNPPQDHYWYGSVSDTPLHIATGAEEYNILELLLRKGADCNLRDSEGRTPFEMALEYDRRERMTQIFGKVGLPIPQISVSVVELQRIIGARSYSDPGSSNEFKKTVARVQQLLADHPELAKASGKRGTTALHSACSSKMLDVAKQLVSLGADINARNNSGNTPLHWASDPEIASFLIDHGAQVDAQNEDGQTPLHRIANIGECKDTMETAGILIENGASKKIEDHFGRTPYDIAVSKKRSENLSLLLQ